MDSKIGKLNTMFWTLEKKQSEYILKPKFGVKVNLGMGYKEIEA
jgi:hypothetical protein